MQEEYQNMMTQEESSIDFQELFYALLSKLWIIIIAGLIGGIVSLLYTNLMLTPTYQSSAQIYILDRASFNENTSISNSDLLIGTQLTYDFEQLLKTRTVSEMVKEKLDLPDKATSIAGKIRVSAIQDTRSMIISVTDSDPRKAQRICNAVAEVSQDYVKEIMDLDAVTIVDRATLPASPFSPSVTKNTLFGMLFGMFIVVAFVLFRFFTDDAIKREEDINRYLGLSVLGCIPLEDSRHDMEGYGFYGNYYGHSSQKED